MLKKFVTIMIIPGMLILSACSPGERAITETWKNNLENSDNTESVNFISSIFNDETYNNLLTLFSMSEQIANRISEDQGITQQTVADILEAGGYGADAAMRIAKDLVDDIATVTGVKDSDIMNVKQSDIMKFLLQEEMSSSVDGLLHVPHDAIEKVRTSIDKIGMEETKELLQKMKDTMDSPSDETTSEVNTDENDQDTSDSEDVS